MKKTSYIEMDYSELESLVMKHFPASPTRKNRDWSFVADHEANNYSKYDFQVTPKTTVDKYDQQKLDEYYKNGQSQFMADVFLDLLCGKGIIEAGDYLIEVFW